MRERTTIKDRSGDGKYFVQIPRLVWALSRSPYDYMLWSVIKEIAGDQGTFECRLSTRDLAAIAMMSTGKVVDSRSYLMEAGLIEGRIEKDDLGQATWHLTIPDVMEENVKFSKSVLKLKERAKYKLNQIDTLRKERSCGEHSKRSCDEHLVHVMNASVHGVNTPPYREEFKEEPKEEPTSKAHFLESQKQKQKKPNAEPLPTAPRSDCAAPAEQRTAAEPPTGSLRADSERPKPGVGVAGVGEDFPSWKRYVMDYYGTRDERAIEKHLKGSDKLDRLTGEKVVAWVARCGTLAEWMRSNVDGTYAGKPANGRSNGIAHGSGLNGRANGHANGKAVPQYNHVTPAQPPPIDEKTLALMVVIAMVTFKNLSITKHAELCQSAAIELSKVGANAEIITAKFGANSWWYQKDWRGQKGSCPTPAQLIEVWGQWENTNGATGANGTNRSTSRNGFIPGRPCQWKGDDGDGTPKPVRTSKRTYDV